MQEQTIVCDECNAEIPKEDVQLWDRILAEDEDGHEVIEQYFDCPFCGHHYSVTVIDRQMKLMIQRRKQLHQRIRLAKRNKSAYQMRKYMEEDKMLEEDLKHRSDAMKEKYLKEE